MNEVNGDLFTWLPPALKGDAQVLRVITTNGTVKKNGEAVMGRGCALEAKTKWPDLPRRLGTELSNWGLKPHLIGVGRGTSVLCFPVKYHWMELASLDLIRESMKDLVLQLHDYGKLRYYRNGGVVMPRPGCGNGRLTWDVVKPVLLEGIALGFKEQLTHYGTPYGGKRMPENSDWLYIISPAAPSEVKVEVKE